MCTQKLLLEGSVHQMGYGGSNLGQTLQMPYQLCYGSSPISYFSLSGFWATPRSAEGLNLVLQEGICPSGLQETIRDDCDQT